MTTERSGHHSYRELLSRRLEERCLRNPRYSLRAFARDLGVSPSRISEILQGKQGLSKKRAVSIANHLGLNKEEGELFCDLVDLEHARSTRSRESALQKIKTHNEERELESTLDSDTFHAISDWYHLPILELTKSRSFQSDPHWIARELGITHLQAKSAIARLKRLGLLMENKGRLVSATKEARFASEVPSDAIRKFHKQILEKAEIAIDLQKLEEREIGAAVFPIDPSKIPEAKKKIIRFRKELSRFLQTGDVDPVYCVSIQFFSLTPNLKSKENRK